LSAPTDTETRLQTRTIRRPAKLFATPSLDRFWEQTGPGARPWICPRALLRPPGEAVGLPPMDAALAIDIGGTKLAVGIVGGDGVLLHRDEAPTPATADAEVLFAALLRLVEALPPAAPVVCGAGCGGPMTRGGEEVSPPNL